jgi:hypothetical protein
LRFNLEARKPGKELEGEKAGKVSDRALLQFDFVSISHGSFQFRFSGLLAFQIRFPGFLTSRFIHRFSNAQAGPIQLAGGMDIPHRRVTLSSANWLHARFCSVLAECESRGSFN